MSNHLLNDLSSLHPVLQRIYAARGVTSLSSVDYSLKGLLHFKGLKNITIATDLLADAILEKKHIVIVGDFDTDGATSTTLAVLALRQFGAAHVDYVVPNRFEYGYGLTPEIVAMIKHADVIMTVDNGISSDTGVFAAKQKGMQVIITDHHLPPEKLPKADVIINPQQLEDQFLSKNLAGVGVIFYVMLALRDRLKQRGWFSARVIPYPEMSHLLDLVALGTVADMVPLDFNNRILVANGLQRIQSLKTRPAFAAFAELTHFDLRHCTAGYLSFNVAPKLNAAGRLKDMSLGIECLLSDNLEKATALAMQLNDLNKERQVLEKEMQKKALNNLDTLNLSTSQSSICLFDQSWHQGITGLVAGRLKERFHKPAAIFAPSQQAGELKGSVRSISGIHIRDVLADIAVQHNDLLSRFGGHAAAAGLSLLTKDYQRFADAFEEKIQKIMDHCTIQNELKTDGVLSQKELTLSFAQLIEKAGPWGQGFEEPTFEGVFDIVLQRLVGHRHLQMTVRLKNTDNTVKAILFNVDTDQWPNHRIQSAKLWYRLNINEWQGRRSVQLHVQKIECVNSQ